MSRQVSLSVNSEGVIGLTYSRTPCSEKEPATLFFWARVHPPNTDNYTQSKPVIVESFITCTCLIIDNMTPIVVLELVANIMLKGAVDQKRWLSRA